LRSAAGKELFSHCKDGARVNNRKAIEGDRFDRRPRIGGGSCRGQYSGSVTVLQAIASNLRRLVNMELLRARWLSDIRKHPGYAKREVKAVRRYGRVSPRSSDRRTIIWQSC
jgi:hypothetical protein